MQLALQQALRLSLSLPHMSCTVIRSAWGCSRVVVICNSVKLAGNSMTR